MAYGHSPSQIIIHKHNYETSHNQKLSPESLSLFVSIFVELDSELARHKLYTVDSRYLEIEGTLKNSSRYPYFDISDL